MGQRGVPDWLTQTLYAHRGLHGEGVPENSLAAAEAAIERGLGIECDIQRSRDDFPMVFHDWELNRLTSANGDFEQRTADELEGLSLLATDQSPARLPRFLETVAGRAPILIEIKSWPGYDVERSCACVAASLKDYAGPHAVMSFDPRVPEWFAQQSSATCRGLVGTDSYLNGFEHVWRQAEIIEQSQPDFLAIDRRDLARAKAAQWRAKERALLCWTVRTGEQRRDAEALADALIAESEALA